MFLDLLKNRRSIRKYTEEPISDEVINKLMTAALMSPSSKRTNGWEFVVVKDKQMLSDLANSREMGSQILEGAAAAIVVCADPAKTDVWFCDASIASLIIQLEAADLGLGSCWVQIYKRDHVVEENGEKKVDMTSGEYVKRLLGIPEHLEVMNIVSLGYKNEERKPYDEAKLLYDKIHREKF